MEITWPQLLTAFGILAGGISGIIAWLAKRDAKRSDDCTARVAHLETVVAAIQEKYVERMEVLLRKSFESNDAMAKGLERIADQLDEQRQSFPRIMREAVTSAAMEFKRGGE